MKISSAIVATGLALGLACGVAPAGASASASPRTPVTIRVAASGGLPSVSVEHSARASDATADEGSGSPGWLNPTNACLALAVVGAFALLSRRRGFD